MRRVAIERADHVVLESTYGDRLHDTQDVEAALGEVIKRTAARGGVVIVPAFAVGRAQALLYAIYRLKGRGAIPDLPVFLNSPMAIDMTEIYHRHRSEHRLSVEECSGLCQVAKMTRTVEESRALNTLRYPAVIVSASGMATGGRVLHHLKAFGPNRRNTIVFAGYQAGGTRGARLLAGERSLRIHGEDITIDAEVVSLPGMSAHADAGQLVRWLSTAPRAPRGIYLNHGEAGPADALRQRIERELGWPAMVPRLGQSVEIGVMHPTGLRLRPLGIDTQQEHVVYMRRDCHVCQAEGFQARTRLEVSLRERRIIATLNVVDSDLLSPGEAGLSTRAWHVLGGRGKRHGRRGPRADPRLAECAAIEDLRPPARRWGARRHHR